MAGFAISYKTGSPWVGVLAAAGVGGVLGAIHAAICNLPRVNYIAVGISMMLFGMGLAFYLGKPYIQPSAPKLPALNLGFWSSIEQVQDALRINALFVVGVVLAPFLAWVLKNTRWGLILRLAGESEEAAAAMGYSVPRIRLIATAVGGALAGVGGSYLSLYYPGSWSEQISSGQGLMAVALVIFARWNPIRCLFASLLFRWRRHLGRRHAGAESDLGLGRLPLVRRTVCANAAHHDRDLFAAPRDGRRAGRTFPGAMNDVGDFGRSQSLPVAL